MRKLTDDICLVLVYHINVWEKERSILVIESIKVAESNHDYTLKKLNVPDVFTPVSKHDAIFFY